MGVPVETISMNGEVMDNGRQEDTHPGIFYSDSGLAASVLSYMDTLRKSRELCDCVLRVSTVPRGSSLCRTPGRPHPVSKTKENLAMNETSTVNHSMKVTLRQ